MRGDTEDLRTQPSRLLAATYQHLYPIIARTRWATVSRFANILRVQRTIAARTLAAVFSRSVSKCLASVSINWLKDAVSCGALGLDDTPDGRRRTSHHLLCVLRKCCDKQYRRSVLSARRHHTSQPATGFWHAIMLTVVRRSRRLIFTTRIYRRVKLLMRSAASVCPSVCLS